jgi:hypothetical protein
MPQMTLMTMADLTKVSPSQKLRSPIDLTGCNLGSRRDPSQPPQQCMKNSQFYKWKSDP